MRLIKQKTAVFRRSDEENWSGNRAFRYRTQMEEALAVAADVGFPCIIRPSLPWVVAVAVSLITAKSLKKLRPRSGSLSDQRTAD